MDRLADSLLPTREQPSPTMGSAREAAVLFDRALATTIDLGLCYFLLELPLVYAVGEVLFGGYEGVAGAAAGLSLALLVPLWITYSFAFEWRFGRTPGKVNRRLVVVMADGSECTLRASAVRNLLRYVDALGIPPMVVGLLSAFVLDGRRVGDLAAGTVVVRTRPHGRRTELGTVAEDVEAGRSLRGEGAARRGGGGDEGR